MTPRRLSKKTCQSYRDERAPSQHGICLKIIKIWNRACRITRLTRINLIAHFFCVEDCKTDHQKYCTYIWFRPRAVAPPAIRKESQTLVTNPPLSRASFGQSTAAIQKSLAQPAIRDSESSQSSTFDISYNWFQNTAENMRMPVSYILTFFSRNFWSLETKIPWHIRVWYMTKLPTLT
jgi:hypothetical protein